MPDKCKDFVRYPTPKLDRAAIRAAAEKATQGPWVSGCVRAAGSLSGWFKVRSAKDRIRDNPIADVQDRCDNPAYFNAQHIANMDPPTTLAILDRIRELEREIEKLKQWSEDDEPLPEDAEIQSFIHENLKTWSKAHQMVSKKRSKFALVDLLNWALVKAQKAETGLEAARERVGELEDFEKAVFYLKNDKEYLEGKLKETTIVFDGVCKPEIRQYIGIVNEISKLINRAQNGEKLTSGISFQIRDKQTGDEVARERVCWLYASPNEQSPEARLDEVATERNTLRAQVEGADVISTNSKTFADHVSGCLGVDIEPNTRYAIVELPVEVDDE